MWTAGAFLLRVKNVVISPLQKAVDKYCHVFYKVSKGKILMFSRMGGIWAVKIRYNLSYLFIA